VKLEISRGDWLLVKKHLTAGEQRQIYTGMMRETSSGTPGIDPMKVGISKLVGYLLDWSFTDADDKPMPIRDQPPETVAAYLDLLDIEDFAELVRVVDTHEDAMRAARDQEKNGDGSTASDPTLPSRAA
jgi:hypothetical protein